MSLKKFKTSSLLIILAGWVTASATLTPTRKFDEFGDVNCEDEMARLDNFAVALLSDPTSKGVMIFYGGRRFRGRLPKRGEAAARVARLKPYLVQRRGVPGDQVIVIDGGYSDEYRVELWITPPGASLPTAHPTIRADQIKFRKGKASPHDYRCRI